jgi:Ca2+:H+ antiporter
MRHLRDQIRGNPMLWLPAPVVAIVAAVKLEPEAHTLHFVLAVLAIVAMTLYLLLPRLS